MKSFIISVCLFYFFSPASFAQESHSLRIEYIGNMGVLLSNGKQSVSIDAFHVFYRKDYQHPSEELVRSLMKGTYKAYPAVEVAMFTHVHGDHYYKGFGAEYLQGNPNAYLMAAAQSCDEAREMLEGKYETQIKEVPYDGTELTLTKGEVCIKAFKLDHANPGRHSRVQNIAYVVEINEQKVLHVGDSEWDPVKRIFPEHKIVEEEIDIAVLPYWMLLYDDPVVNLKTYISPKHIIATHIPPDLSSSDAHKLKQLFPGITLFREIGKDIWETP